MTTADSRLPYRAVPTAGPPMSREPVDEVECSLPLPDLPSNCACCGGDATLKQTLPATLALALTPHIPTLAVRYCHRCMEHVESGRRRTLDRGALAAAAGLTVTLALALLWPYVPKAFGLAVGPFVALTALWAFDRRSPPRPVDRGLGCTAGERDPVWIAGLDTSRGVIRIRATNRAWLADVAPGDPRRVVRHGHRGPRWGLWVGVPATCLVGALPCWALTHGEVHFDNPTGEAIVVDVDRGARTLRLAPGAHASLDLPAGPRAIVVTDARGASDRFVGLVRRGGDHAATPFAAACYGFSNAAYGTEQLVGDALTRVPLERRWHDIDGVQAVFAPLPRAVRVSGSRRGATRTRFGQVECAAEVDGGGP